MLVLSIVLSLVDKVCWNMYAVYVFEYRRWSDVFLCNTNNYVIVYYLNYILKKIENKRS